MNATVSATRLLVVAVLSLVLAPAVALAGTSYQTTLVPMTADSQPGFSSKGSSIKIVSSGNLKIKGKIKRVVDEFGERVPSEDEYCVEVDLLIPTADVSTPGPIQIPFRIRNGNGSFKTILDKAILTGAEKGDAVVVEEVRVLDSCTNGEMLGYGGVAIKN